jgi:hypothetical protein
MYLMAMVLNAIIFNLNYMTIIMLTSTPWSLFIFLKLLLLLLFFRSKGATTPPQTYL